MLKYIFYWIYNSKKYETEAGLLIKQKIKQKQKKVVKKPLERRLIIEHAEKMKKKIVIKFLIHYNYKITKIIYFYA